MKKTIALLVATATLGMHTQAEAGVLNVYLQGGQSNAVGYAQEFSSFNPLTYALPANLRDPQPEVQYYYEWDGSHAQDSAGQVIDLEPVFNEVGHSFGPEITFGNSMATYHGSSAGDPNVAIVKYADGGTSLATHWAAGGDGSTSGDGSVYQSFQSAVSNGLAALAAANPGDTINIVGMIWVQGENDASDTEYGAKLTTFIADIRATYGSDLAFVIGGIAGTGAGFDTVRTQQANVASADPNTVYVDSTPWNNPSFKNAGDDLHFNSDGQQALGNGIATAMQTIVPANPVPEPASLGLLALGGTLLLRRRRKC